MMGGKDQYSPEAQDTKPETFTSTQIMPLAPGKKKSKIKNKRRFSDEQIRLMESIFESDTKLEPRKKLQLARELGLQPRQVAIWFQNRRARWKSKQIEQEYRILKVNYDALASQFESLKKEKQSLLIQLQNLGDLLGQPHDGNRESKGFEQSSTGGSSYNGDIKREPEAQEGLYQSVCMCSHSNKSMDDRHSGDEVPRILNMTEYVGGSLASPERWHSLDSGGPFDPPCSSSHWLSFWN